MIEFEADGVDIPQLDTERIQNWLMRVAAAHGYRVGNLNYRFIGDEEMLVANRQFVGHDYYTDIITFDYTRADVISGDILISLDTVATNAEKFAQPYERELHRVIVHGVLHLCGIDDKGPGQREVMEAEEEKALKIY